MARPALRGALVLLGLLTVIAGACRKRPPAGPTVSSLDIPALRARLAKAASSRDALELAEAIKCRDLRKRLLRAGSTPHALTDVDRVPMVRLDEDQAVLSFFVDGSRLRRFWARGSSGVRELRSLELASIEALSASTRDELELGDDLRGNKLASLLAAAGKELFQAAELSSLRRLLIIPDGLIRALPVHALLWERQPLATFLEIAYAPCLGLLRLTKPALGRAQVLAPAYGREAQPLHGAAEEAAVLRRALGSEITVRLGRDATAARFEESLSTPGALLHFGGHGVADLQAGHAPQLVFPDGERGVTVRSATRRPVRAALVVLASCATAEVARFRDGRHLLAEVTLPDALIAGGAERVVAASWAVKDQQSALQMATFYQHLRELGPAAALARAQRLSRAGIDPPHPRFWAFYAVYGGW